MPFPQPTANCTWPVTHDRRAVPFPRQWCYDRCWLFVDVQRNKHTVCAKCCIFISRNVAHVARTVLDWEVTALLYVTSSQIIWRTWRRDTAERTGHPCSGPHSDRSLAAKARGRYALVWLHPHLHFTTPDRILIRPLNPPSISQPDKWLPSPFVHAKGKVSAISTEKKQLALTKQSPLVKWVCSE